MPILGGLFSKKSKPQRSNGQTSDSAYGGSEIDSTLSSPTTDFVSADHSIPSSPNGKGLPANSSKIRLAFSRKKTFERERGPELDPQYLAPPRMPHKSQNSISSEADLPPPSRTALFGRPSFDPGSSTRSLPTERVPGRHSPPSSPTKSFQQPPKRPGLFGWTKSAPGTAKSAKLQKPSGASKDLASPVDDSSFNLKSFRHVQVTSPEPPPLPNASSISLSPSPGARPRPRAPSAAATDSSQRISVAAFREMQAKRSNAGSPAPSVGRTPSPHLGQDRGRADQRDGRGIASRSQSRLPVSRRSTALYDSDPDEDESSRDSDDSDGDGVSRRKTVTTNNHTTKRPEAGKKRATKSEVGHGYVNNTSRQGSAPLSQSNLHSARQTPGGVPQNLRQNTGHVRHASTIYSAPSQYSQDSDSDSDDAPLATLVPPRRPGSAMSNSSNSSLGRAAARKPLIDINEITKANRPPNVPPKSENKAGFTGGPTLLSSGRPSPSSTGMTSPVTSISPPVYFADPVASPEEEKSGFNFSPTSNARKAPIRQETAPTLTSMVTQQPVVDKKRDHLSERLTKVVKQQQKASTLPLPPAASDKSVSPAASLTELGIKPSGKGAESEETTVKARSPLLKNNPYNRSMSTGPSTVASRESAYDMSDLASMLGAGVSLISFNGEEPEPPPREPTPPPVDPDVIAPRVIKQRAPAPSFSVTSRPRNHQAAAALTSPPLVQEPAKTVVASSTVRPVQTRARSTTLSTPSASQSSITSVPPLPVKQASAPLAATTKLTATTTSRPRQVPAPDASSSEESSSSESSEDEAAYPTSKAPVSSRPRSISAATAMKPVAQPTKKPAAGTFSPPIMSRPQFSQHNESPASSTGGSSSGRIPLTPADGSDIGTGVKRPSPQSSSDRWSGGASGLGLGKHAKRRSVSFEEDLDVTGAVGKPKSKEPEHEESRRRERRRSEAKAAIDLGNVINGRGPVVEEDDEDDVPINQTMSVRMGSMNMNPLVPQMTGMSMNGMNPGMQQWTGMSPWQSPMMGSPQFLAPPSNDPSFIAAHAQAMMYAKHAYQMAVAQQAMAAAADEWERGSTMSFAGGGGGGTGSVYGGASPPSMLSPPPMMGIPYGMGMGNSWSTGSMVGFPSSQSVYGGGGGAMSDYGGPSNRMSNWNSSRSVYGESFGPSPAAKPSPSRNPRDSGYFPPPSQQHSSSSRPSPMNNNSNSRNRTVSQPANPNLNKNQRRAPPPSSWKASP